MKIIAPQKNNLLEEGEYPAYIKDFVEKETRKGRMKFLRLSLTSAGRNGHIVDFLLPRYLNSDTKFFQLLVAVFGSLNIGEEINGARLRALAGTHCTATIKHVKRSDGRVFANVVALH